MRKVLFQIGFVPLIGAGMLAIALAAPAPRVKADEKTKKAPTYSTEVARILNAHCVSCHRPGEVAPFSLQGYDNAKKKSAMIAKVTESGLMPPWKTRPTDLEFDQQNVLTDAEKQTLQDWAESGATHGDPQKEPKPPKFNEGWALGKPDLMLEMPKEFHLGAEGKDEYWNFVLKPDLKEPVYVQAVDVHPGNRRVVHHVIAFLDDSGRAEKKLEEPGAKDGGYLTSGGGVGILPSGSLGGWAPGVMPARAEPGTGFLLKPGTSVILQVHYNKSGKEEVDRTKVGLYFAKEKVTKPLRIAWLLNFRINIKAGDPDAKFSQTFVVPADAELHSLMPHMHMLGQSVKATATLPDGKVISLIDVPKWDFNWQLVYKLKQPKLLPKGTVIKLEATYDNSANNPNNPSSPPRRVKWGEETKDEMMLLVAVVSFEGDWMYVLG